jgi:hypothetical protein
MTAAQAKLWLQKWRWYERNTLPWNRARIHWEMARREAFVRWPVHGNVLEALLEERLEVGAGDALRARGVDHRSGRRPRAHRRGHLPEPQRHGGERRAGRDRLALHVRQRLLRHRWQPSLRRPRAPGHLAGLHHQGPTRIGDNVWCGANVVITSGVTIGERCVIGANSVVTADIPAGSIAAGSPARVLKAITWADSAVAGAS